MKDQSLRHQFAGGPFIGEARDDKRERAAELVLITPKGEKTHRITYGGPPRSLARWSVNLALDWLRRRAMENE